MRKWAFVAALSLACLSVAWLSGCGGGSATTLSIEIIPPASGLSVDVGAAQPLNFTAAVGDDTTNAGVTWMLSGSSCSGDGCGTLSNQGKFSVSYTAPPAPLPSSAALSVTLTATSVAKTNVTQTSTITVEPLPTFTTVCNPPGVTIPCGLPGGANGEAYVAPIQITGGVAPYTFAVINGASALSSACLKLTATQTSNTSTSVAGKPCNGGSTQTVANFTIQITDTGGAAPVTQSFSVAIAAAPSLSITTTSLANAYLNAQYQQSVEVDGGVLPITWSVTPPAASSLPPGLSFNSGNGQITGIPNPQDVTGSTCTPVQAGTYCFTVTVTDSALLPPDNHHQTQMRAYSITVQQPGPLSIVTPAGPLAAGTTATGYGASLQATGGVTPYTWTLIQGQLPSGLTLSTSQSGSGIISGVPTVAEAQPYTFSVQLTDSEIAPQTKTATYTISVAANQDNNSLLQGSYSFVFHGFDKDGSVAMIGTITADGNGNLSGSEVINRVSGVAPGATLTGTYVIDSTGGTNGPSGDGRGTMELTASFGQQTVTSEYELALEPDGSAQFFQDHDYPSPPPANPDAFATHGEGVMKPVLGSSFAVSNFSGNYAFELTGVDGKKPVALVGSIHADGAGTLSPGTCDFNDAGTYGSQSLSGSFGFTGGTLGTASFTLEVPKTGLQTLQFAYAFVSNSDLYFIEIDATGSTNTPTLYRLSGEMISQQPSTKFDANSLSGASIATATGVDSSGNAIVTAGLLSSSVCDGTTQNSIAYDQNDGGTIASPSLADTCMVNPTNGRVAFTWIQPAPPAAAIAPPFAATYLIGPGEGFLIGSDATVTTGLLELQTGGAQFADSSVEGNYALGAPFIVEPGVDNLLGQTFADGSGTFSGTVDEADASATSQTLNQSFAAMISAIGPNGRGTMTTTAPVPTGFPTQWIFYVVSGGRIRAIPDDAGNKHPEVIFLGP
jgi:Putative Ig domain